MEINRPLGAMKNYAIGHCAVWFNAVKHLSYPAFYSIFGTRFGAPPGNNSEYGDFVSVKSWFANLIACALISSSSSSGEVQLQTNNSPAEYALL